MISTIRLAETIIALMLSFAVSASTYTANPKPVRTIANVSDHPYSTVTSVRGQLAVVSGSQGADLINYGTGQIIQRLNLSGSANSAIFVQNGDQQMLYVMAFTNAPGAQAVNGIYGYPIKGDTLGNRLEYNKETGMKGDVFPDSSFALSASSDGKNVYFVTLEDTHTAGEKSTGKRWLNRISVNPKVMKVTPVPMPDWTGWPRDGGDDGVAVLPDNSAAYLPHSLTLYKVRHPASENPIVTIQTPIHAGDGMLPGPDNQTLFAFEYGNVYRYQLPGMNKTDIFIQPGSHQSLIQNAQLYAHGRNLLLTLQAVAFPKAGANTGQSQKRDCNKGCPLFPLNEVLSIDLATLKKTTLYKAKLFFGGYPTSAAVSADGKYLLVTVWYLTASPEHTDLLIFNIKDLEQQKAANTSPNKPTDEMGDPTNWQI